MKKATLVSANDGVEQLSQAGSMHSGSALCRNMYAHNYPPPPPFPNISKYGTSNDVEVNIEAVHATATD